MEYDRKTEGMKEIMITIADVAREAGHGQQGAEQERSGIAGSP